MKFILLVSLIALSTWLAELIFPWWSAALCAALLTSLIPTRGFKAFLSGFLGVGLLWLFGALLFSIQTDYILTQKVAELMQLGSSGVLIVITALIGALTGGLGALTGHQLRMLLKSRKRRKGSRYRSSY
jgi:hypothetical protein